MKVLIFNSGLGSRLGRLTEDRPKAMVALTNGETIFHRQLRILCSVGFRDFVVTTGPFQDLLKAEATEFTSRGCRIEFVNNPEYNSTNYIYSMWLARDLLRDDDILMLHGDLVFDASYVKSLSTAPEGSWGSVDPTLPVPKKDFSADVDENGYIQKVGVGIDGDRLMAFQAMYRLTSQSMGAWLDEVESFVERGEVSVYAENAANVAFSRMCVRTFPYTEHILEEIDTPEDLARVSSMILKDDYKRQPVLELSREELQGPISLELLPKSEDIIETMVSLGSKNPMLVCDSYFVTRLDGVLDGALLGFPVFSNFSPNPAYPEVLEAVRFFRAHECDGIVSLGGGSAIDVAKCVKLFCRMEGDGEKIIFPDQEFTFNHIPHLAIPTTAGTGSESTHFAVLYVNGMKRSVAHSSALPDVAVLDSRFLVDLPIYQKKATLLDALCHAVESYWSVRSVDVSRRYASEALKLLLENQRSYLLGDPLSARKILLASNLAGRAINLTTTTAGHAMAYGLTSRYKIAHGHAAALCLGSCWQLLRERCDERTAMLLDELDATMQSGYGIQLPGERIFARLLDEIDIGGVSTDSTACDAAELALTVDTQRLGNFPITLEKQDIQSMYEQILG